MADWNAAQYLKFEDERTRPAIDLLHRVPLSEAQRCVDLGCGPGNSTALVLERFPGATVSGLDSSPEMLAKARDRLASLRFDEADIAAWRPRERFDLIFANAALHWVRDHQELVPRLAGFLTRGGCLAVQVPDDEDEPAHRLMGEVAQEGPWAQTLACASAARESIASFEACYGWLHAAGCTVDLWRTTYVHALDGAAAIVEWFKSTGLRPYLDPLSAAERSAYLALYQDRIAQAYPAQPDGKVLLRFPRLFFVAQRR